MKLLKHLVIILVFANIQVGCAQNDSKEKNNTMNSLKTDYIQEMLNVHTTVKMYDYNPIYLLKVNAAFCTYEIFINDMLADFSFTTGNTAGEQPIQISQFIPVSKDYRMKIKVYPKAVEPGILAQSIDVNAILNVRVMYGDFQREMPSNFHEVMNIAMPNQEVPVPYYEFDTVFNAKVPYVLEAWNKGMDLSKEDPKKLEKEAIALYDEFSNIFKTKNLEKFARLTYKRRREVSQAYFFNKASIDKEWVNGMQEVFSGYTGTQEFSNFKLEYFGGNKVIGLIITEGKFKSHTAFAVKSNGGIEFFPLYLYRPSPGAPLEVIR